MSNEDLFLHRKIHLATQYLLSTSDNAIALNYWGISFDDACQYLREATKKIGPELRHHYSKENVLRGQASIFNEKYKQTQIAEVFAQINNDDTTIELSLDKLKECAIIGLNGPIGAGKDTLADAMSMDGSYKIAFADAIRVGASLLYSIPMVFFTDRVLKDQPLDSLDGYTPRKVLQLFGTEMMRSIDSNFWIKKMTQSISSALQIHSIKTVVISDVRTEEEAAYVRTSGKLGFMCFIESHFDHGNPLDAGATQHKTEQGIIKQLSDVTIRNTGSLEQFKTTAKLLIADTIQLRSTDSAKLKHHTQRRLA